MDYRRATEHAGQIDVLVCQGSDIRRGPTAPSNARKLGIWCAVTATLTQTLALYSTMPGQLGRLEPTLAVKTIHVQHIENFVPNTLKVPRQNDQANVK